MNKNIKIIAAKKEDEYEICVLCKKMTKVPFVQSIEQRNFYIEGAGQLCYNCYWDLYKR